MDNVFSGLSFLEGVQELIQKIIGRTFLPGGRSIQIYTHNQPVVHPACKDTFRRGVITQPEARREVLQ